MSAEQAETSATAVPDAGGKAETSATAAQDAGWKSRAPGPADNQRGKAQGT